ncbi:hypothetical protein OOU_Y34scaffold00149g4 [Pyricularia oryzae Y34]|uniref:Uncharacterized protein n=2 Tax=Pyricularia oryzae TaxID=318829 RepID=A0AA97PQS0_PYRO3|nr:hypothetical protein OOU_Y34scaffold00149g4 [Pyricularia oryzae Y34]
MKFSAIIVIFATVIAATPVDIDIYQKGSLVVARAPPPEPSYQQPLPYREY